MVLLTDFSHGNTTLAFPKLAALFYSKGLACQMKEALARKD